ncbi:hypothetical protein DC20_00785 [Rufibacter tibetensis]|uniref:Uncharacterized protein n=1 Tax=Rufibacter tibetensis TaxID=512763 RepID=A0A0P0CU17_9BACT|nr:hypothetical protein DC20_00785 [Rufibacter tibetensis]
MRSSPASAGGRAQGLFVYGLPKVLLPLLVPTHVLGPLLSFIKTIISNACGQEPAARASGRVKGVYVLFSEKQAINTFHFGGLSM